MPVVSTKIGRVGGLICWESESQTRGYLIRELIRADFMPLARYVLYKKGVEM